MMDLATLLARALHRDVLPVPGGPCTNASLEVPTYHIDSGFSRALDHQVLSHLEMINLAACKLKASLYVGQQVLL